MQCGHSRSIFTSIWMFEASFGGLFSEWGFPTCLCGNQRQSDGEKAGGWNHRKEQSESERMKENKRQADRLKCRYSQKKERGRLTTKDTGCRQRAICFEYWIVYHVAFPFSCALLTSSVNSRGLVWSVILSLLFDQTFLLVLSNQIFRLKLQKTERGIFQLLTLRKLLWS